MTATITDTDRGLRARLRAVARLGGYEVAVGVLHDTGDAPHEDSDLTVLEVASIHEFGAPAAGIPQRSFVRAWVDENRPAIAARQRALATQVLAGKLTEQQALDQLGAWAAGQIQQRISAGIAPPNAASTVDRKGSATPLIDSGQLRSSVSWAVRRRSR